MAYRVTYHSDWIHVEYLDVVDGFDVLNQYRQVKFHQAMHSIKKIIFDYTHAVEVNLSIEDTDSFVTLAKVQSCFSVIHVAVVPKFQDGLERAEHYKARLADSNWRVNIATSLAHAKTLLNIHSH